MAGAMGCASLQRLITMAYTWSPGQKAPIMPVPSSRMCWGKPP